jgi:hypothetical protein
MSLVVPVDDGDLDLPGVEGLAEAVGDQGASGAATQDHDPLRHGATSVRLRVI